MLGVESIEVQVPQSLRQQHFGYVLPNGVKCIIVKDDKSTMPAVAMTIHAGQLNDPPELPGLAHFCEHMLFMGTAKYPREDEYDAFITSNNGMDNAFTTLTTTTYYFSIGTDALEGALERFVEFFVSPSFNHNAMERELMAVHSEDEKNHNSDIWRLHELMREDCSAEHPYSRYGNGNLTTLRDEATSVDLRAKLVEFYEKHYVSDNACLVVFSSRDPEDILKVVVPPLSQMKRGSPALFRFLEDDTPIFPASLKNSWYNVHTLKSSRTLRLQWYVRSAQALWPCTPSAYLSHIIGHECDSSAFGIMKKRGLATSMIAGPAQRIDDDIEEYMVQVDLSTQGLQRVNEVITLIYQAIGQTTQDGVNRQVYDQMVAETVLDYESMDISSAMRHCMEISSSALVHGVEYCLRTSLIEENMTETLKYAAQITPSRSTVYFLWGKLPCESASEIDNADKESEGSNGPGLVEGPDGSDEFVVGADDSSDSSEGKCGGDGDPLSQLPDFARRKADSSTRFHKGRYSRCTIPKEVIDEWEKALSGPFDEGLALPKLNPYISKDFTIFPPCDSAPVVTTIQSAHGTTLVRKDAHCHKSFLSCLTFIMLFPETYSSITNWIYSRVMSSIVDDLLTEVSYFGSLASLANLVSLNPGGIEITVTGPYSELFSLFDTMLIKAVDFKQLRADADKFSVFLDLYTRRVEGFVKDQPFELVLDRLNNISVVAIFSFEDVLTAIPSVSYEGYLEFLSNLQASGCSTECFIAGNVPSTAFVEEQWITMIEQRLSEAKLSPPTKEFARWRDTSLLRTPDTERLKKEGNDIPITSLDLVTLPPFNDQNKNIAVLLAICAGPATAENNVLCSCAAKLMSTVFFNALRTREKLGYVVNVSARAIDLSTHIHFTVQSALDGVDGTYLISRVIAFLTAFEENFDSLCTETTFQQLVKGLIDQRLKLPDAVDSDVRQLRREYLSYEGKGGVEKEIAFLKGLTLNDVKCFMRKFVFNNRTEAQALVIVINGSNSNSASSTEHHVSGSVSIVLPSQREDEDAAAPDGEGLALPTYSDGSVSAEFTQWGSIAEYKHGLEAVRSTTI